MPKITDEALSDHTVKAEADAALHEPAAPEPADFDLVAWLSGITPVVAHYPLPGGGFIPLRARSMEWRREWAEATKDATDEDKALAFLAAHIADERVTPEMLSALAAHRPRDFDAVCSLALAVDDKPAHQIDPRFLPAASD